jgi:hypothetical protein
VIKKIENRDHKLAVTFEDAFEAVMIAILTSDKE